MKIRPPIDKVKRKARIFAALGDETRLHLVMRLASNGPGSITHLSAKSKVSRQAISKHLDVLRDAGLVTAVVDDPHARVRDGTAHRAQLSGSRPAMRSSSPPPPVRAPASGL